MLGVVSKLRNRRWGGGVSPNDYSITWRESLGIPKCEYVICARHFSLALLNFLSIAKCLNIAVLRYGVYDLGVSWCQLEFLCSVLRNVSMAVKCVRVSVSIVSTMMVAHCEVWVPLCRCSVYCGIVTQCLLGSVPVWNCYAMPHNGCSEEWSLLLLAWKWDPSLSASWNSSPVNLATHQGALQSNTLNIIIINNSIVTLIITTTIVIITNIINMVMIGWGKRVIKKKNTLGVINPCF